MKLNFTLRQFMLAMIGGIFIYACSTDGYGDDSSNSNNNTNSVSANDQSGSQGNSDPYGEGGDTSSSTGEGLEAPDSQLNFDVTNSGAAAYVFNNYELDNVENPTITLKRGQTYTFSVEAPGHPLIIKTVKSTTTTNAFNEGVANNGIASGTITIEVTEDTPDTLYYNCEFHSSMSGVIIIED